MGLDFRSCESSRIVKYEEAAYEEYEEAAWPSGQRVGLAIQRSLVRVPLWPLARFVYGTPEFKSSATLVNSQLVCLRPVGILNNVMFNLNYLFQLFEWHACKLAWCT